MRIHIPFTGISFKIKWSHLFVGALAIFSGVSARKDSDDSSVEITQPQPSSDFGTEYTQPNSMMFAPHGFQIHQGNTLLLFSDPDIISLSSRTCPRELTNLKDKVFMSCHHEPTMYGNAYGWSPKEDRIKDATSCSFATINLQRLEAECELLTYLESFNNRLQNDAQKDSSTPIRVVMKR